MLKEKEAKDEKTGKGKKGSMGGLAPETHVATTAPLCDMQSRLFAGKQQGLLIVTEKCTKLHDMC